jgi:hypothetical protein
MKSPRPPMKSMRDSKRNGKFRRIRFIAADADVLKNAAEIFKKMP